MTTGSPVGRWLVSVQSVVVDPADRLWLFDTGSPMFAPTSHGGPEVVRVDLATDTVEQVVLFPTDVALGATYLNDVRFDLSVGEAGFAYITDSADSGPNGMIVVDLATGESWRRLHEHPSTTALEPPDLRMVVEGQDFLERDEDGSTSPVTMGADGIAISADGDRLFYCCLASRRWWSVATAALRDRALDDAAAAQTVRDEGDKGSVGDGMGTDDASAVRHRRRARRDLPAPARRHLGDGGLRPAAAVAGHHVGRRRRPPARHRQPAVPAGGVPRREGRAAAALRPVQDADRRRPRPARPKRWMRATARAP